MTSNAADGTVGRIDLPWEDAMRRRPRNVAAIPVPRTVRGKRLAKLVLLVWTWGERRRQRRALAALDDRLLRDIGKTRSDAAAEVRKPFWRG